MQSETVNRKLRYTNRQLILTGAYQVALNGDLPTCSQDQAEFICKNIINELINKNK